MSRTRSAHKTAMQLACTPAIPQPAAPLPCLSFLPPRHEQGCPPTAAAQHPARRRRHRDVHRRHDRQCASPSRVYVII
ncbi:hypothetical protein B0H10DRAFT_2054513, partial [Mycena sp. CBHHK59/15]